MLFTSIKKEIEKFVLNSIYNYVQKEDAIRPDLVGMQIYDSPLVGVASAKDPLFGELRKPEIVGEEVLLPREWLSNANCIISFFLPFTESVRKSNREVNDRASDEWLHARIEGQILIDRLGDFLCQKLASEGHKAVCPASDQRFKMIAPYASNWSERHVAYICGLGTFGLSKGLITKKGVAGRFGSVITSAELPVTEREYSSPFEYCIMCGKCQKSCPVHAIDISKGVAKGKDQEICGSFVKDSFLPPHGVNKRRRYGCGKCQVGVPCEKSIPQKDTSSNA